MVFNATSGGGTSSGFNVTYSCRFNDDDSAYTAITPGAGTANTTWTFSTWFKRGNLTSAMSLLSVGADTSNYTRIGLNAADRLEYIFVEGAGTVDQVIPTRLYRDPSAWHHLVVAVDTTQATDTNRVKIYLNGVRETVFTTTNWPADSDATDIGTAVAHELGRHVGGSLYFDGYMSETFYIDGQQLTPGAFGEIRGDGSVWGPKRYGGTYGTNGFYLNYSSSSDYGSDKSGNANDLTDSGLATNDQVSDTPTNNFCTLNIVSTAAEEPTISNGNLQYSTALGGNVEIAATFAIPATGKWVFEVSGTGTAGNDSYVAFLPLEYDFQSTMSALADGMVFLSTGLIEVDNDGGTAQGAGYGDANGVLIRFEYDRDGNSLETFYDNVSKGTVTWDGNSKPLLIVAARGGGTATANFNFGQLGGLNDTPTSGFKTLSSANLSTPAVTVPSSSFNSVIYTGTGAEQAIASLSFQPDIVWIKQRGSVGGAKRHMFFDAVRGAGKFLNTDDPADELDHADNLTSFDSNGFTLGVDTTTARVNQSTASLVAWCWKADGTGGTSNTSGTITSVESINAAAGISVLTYTGTGAAATIGHGLGVAPGLIITKPRVTVGADSGWAVYHSSNTAAPETDALVLDTNAATSDSPNWWNDTAPTSTTFTVGIASSTNIDGDTYGAYLFAEIEGFSKFGSWTGNANADGPFVWCGFRPRFVLFKNTNTTDSWYIHDTSRSTYNPSILELNPDTTQAEGGTVRDLDFLSNGFKCRSADNHQNGSGNTIIFAAFAESPFKYARAG